MQDFRFIRVCLIDNFKGDFVARQIFRSLSLPSGCMVTLGLFIDIEGKGNLLTFLMGN